MALGPRTLPAVRKAIARTRLPEKREHPHARFAISQSNQALVRKEGKCSTPTPVACRTAWDQARLPRKPFLREGRPIGILTAFALEKAAIPTKGKRVTVRETPAQLPEAK